MKKLIGCFEVKKGYGYNVFICDLDGTVIDTYSAGDSKCDSQLYGTGELDYDTLLKHARQTTKDMLAENSAEKPYIVVHQTWSE